MKVVKEYFPPDILLSKEAMKNILVDFQNREKANSSSNKYKELTITLILSLVGCIISIVGAFSAMTIIWRAITCIISGVLLIFICICVFKWIESYKQVKACCEAPVSVDDILLRSVQDTIQYTAIMRVTTKIKGEMNYLVGPDYFLPHCAMTVDANLDEQGNNILQALHDDFGIQEGDVLTTKLLTDQVYFSIKPIHGSVKMNAYAFYDVEIKVQAKAKISEIDSRRSWMSLSRMRQKPEALATNKDVIDLLDTFPKPKDSFVNVLGNISLIWNITSNCGYNCAICATYDENRENLDADGRLTVLNNIFTAKSLIKTIDFAGGDPLYSEDTFNLIQTAIGQLGADKISVTTTGKGIKELAARGHSFFSKIKHCEITIDAAHTNLATGSNIPSAISRNEDAYCEMNFDQVNLLLEHAESLTINIPIINDDLSDDEIKVLVNKICWIKQHNPHVEIDALLIRLMPVGRLGQEMSKEVYQTYNPISVAQKIKDQLSDKDIICNLHCSLRILPCFNALQCSEHCTMLENKLGIDCAGNVFACAWGGYLYSQDPLSKNPFYLGNLTHVSLIDILEGRSRTAPYRDLMADISSKQHRNFCSVVSYYASGQMRQNSDYLATK